MMKIRCVTQGDDGSVTIELSTQDSMRFASVDHAKQFGYPAERLLERYPSDQRA